MDNIQKRFSAQMNGYTRLLQSNPSALPELLQDMADKNKLQDFRLLSLLSMKDMQPFKGDLQNGFLPKEEFMKLLYGSSYEIDETVFDYVLTNNNISMKVSDSGEILYNAYDTVSSLYIFFNK